MKVLAFCILHYGKPFLSAAIQSLLGQVDKILILYTPKPSQGFQTDAVCPDTHADLTEEFYKAMATKNERPCLFEWVNGEWPNEVAHIEAVWPYAVSFDWLWRFDADEVVKPGMVAEMIEQAKETNHREYRVPFIHFWRSFNDICRDGQMPVRLMRCYGGETKTARYLDARESWYVYHFGYCQPTRYIEYKLQVSGHRPEFRKDWLITKWLPNAKEDLHPVCLNFWNTMPFNKNDLPEILHSHPYFNLEVVE